MKQRKTGMSRAEKKALRKKRRKSLSRAILRLVLIVGLCIFLSSTVLSWLVQQVEMKVLMTVSSQSAAVGTMIQAENTEGFEEYARSIMETYYSIPEDLRLAQSEEYFAYFEKYDESPVYKELVKSLRELNAEIAFSNTYFAAFDEKNEVLVYLLDPFDVVVDFGHRTGEWVSIDLNEVERIENKDDKASAFYLLTGGASYSTLKAREDKYGVVMTGGIPIRNEEGNVYAFAMADIFLMAANVLAAIVTIIYVVMLLVIILVIVFISRRVVKKRLVKPIRQISDAAENYVRLRKEKNGEVRNTAVFRNVTLKKEDELQDLCNVMADMEEDIASYEADLVKITTEQERIRTELDVAGQIQENLLPTNFLSASDGKRCDIFAVMDPAREVGGDFYDFFTIDEDHLALVMADVSGKGIPASLFMMASMIILHNLALEGYSPAVVLEKANERICSTNRIDMFVTVWLGILDLQTGEVTAANAGHEYPVIRHAGGSFELLKDRHGFVIGGMEGMKYREYGFTLEPGSVLFLYTDGVPEATNSREMLYGTDRMLAALNNASSTEPTKLLKAVRDDVDAFVQEAPQFDDLTMMAVKYNGTVNEEEQDADK